jgi:hypothetical protein
VLCVTTSVQSRGVTPPNSCATENVNAYAMLLDVESTFSTAPSRRKPPWPTLAIVYAASAPVRLEGHVGASSNAAATYT